MTSPTESIRLDFKLSEIFSEEDLTCPVTHLIMKDPRQLPCGHNFSKKGIEEWFNKNKERFSCPSCRQEFKELTLTPNLFLKNMIVNLLKEAKKQKNLQNKKKENIGGHRSFKDRTEKDDGLDVKIQALIKSLKSKIEEHKTEEAIELLDKWVENFGSRDTSRKIKEMIQKIFSSNELKLLNSSSLYSNSSGMITSPSKRKAQKDLRPEFLKKNR